VRLPNGCITMFTGFRWRFIGTMCTFVQPVVLFDIEVPIPPLGGQPTAEYTSAAWEPHERPERPMDM
jgi:hypothetical protein